MPDNRAWRNGRRYGLDDGILNPFGHGLPPLGRRAGNRAVVRPKFRERFGLWPMPILSQARPEGEKVQRP